MLFNVGETAIETKEKAGIPYETREAFGVVTDFESTFIKDYKEDILHDYFDDAATYIKNKYDLDIIVPYDMNRERDIMGINNNVQANEFYANYPVGSERHKLVYETAKKKLFNQINNLRLAYPEDKNLKELPASDAEIEQAIDKFTLNKKAAYQMYQQSDYPSLIADLSGSVYAQLTDSPNIAYIGLLATGLGGAYNLGRTAFQRIALTAIEGGTGAAFVENIQQKANQDLVKRLNLSLNNPKVRKDLIEIGINPDQLKLTEDQLQTRLLYAFGGGFLLAGGVQSIGEAGASIFRRIMQGDPNALKLIDDASNEFKATREHKEIRDMTPQEKIKHIQNIAQASDRVMRTRKFNERNYVELEPMENIDEAIKDIEQIYQLTFTKKQKRNLKTIMDTHNYNIKVHNSVLEKRMLNYDSDLKVWNLKLPEYKTNQIVQTAKDIETTFNELATKQQVSIKDKQWLEQTLKGLKDVRDFTNPRKYNAALSKDPDVRKRQIINDNKKLELMRDLLKHKAKYDKRLGRYMPMQKLVTDFLEVSYARDVIPGNVVSTQKATFQDLMSRLDDEELHTVNWKKQKDFDPEDIVREIYNPGSTGQQLATKIAEKFALMLEDARLMKNSLGGNVAKRKNYMPQSHDITKVGKAKIDDWVNDIFEELDLTITARNYGLADKYFVNDILTSKGEEELKRLLANTKDNIALGHTTNSLRETKPGEQTRMSKDFMRFLIFKDAESYLRYNEKYGRNAIESIIMYLDHTATDIGLMKTFGEDVYENAKFITKFARDYDAKATGKNQRPSTTFDNLFDTITGRGNIPERKGLAKFMGEVRAYLVSTKLGGAFISSLSDLPLGQMARFVSGMPMTKQLKNHAKFMVSNKKVAKEANVVASEIIDEMRHGQRMTGELQNGPFSWMAQNLLKVSLLTPSTIAARTAFKYEFQFHLKNLAAQSFDSIGKRTKYMYKRYGITKEDHEALQKIKLHKSSYDNTVSYVRISDIADKDLKQKMYAWMFAETEFAVPSYLMRSRAFMMGNNRPGTGMGEIRRSFWLFKNFPMTIMYTHMARNIDLLLSKEFPHGAAYALSSQAILMMSGYLIYNSKLVLKGEDTQPMNYKTLVAGYLQGGGGGYAADLLFQDTTRFGQGRIGAALGPVFGLGEDLLDFGLGPLSKAIYKGDPEFDKFPAALASFLKQNIPYGNLWYTRMFTDHMFAKLQQKVDPNYYKKKRKYEKRLAKERRSKYIDTDSLRFKRPPEIQLFRWKSLGD